MEGNRHINPIQGTTPFIVNKIRETFGLDEYPFSEMEDDILLLAFTPICQEDSIEYPIFTQKYRTCDHQTLEFYGDRILYGIIADIMYDFFEFTMTPQFYTSLNILITGNRLLTDLMMEKGGCELVRSKRYYIEERGKTFHNPCADTLEALIGAMYSHFRSKKTPYNSHIKNWLLKNTVLPYVLRSYLNDFGFTNKQVYVVNNRIKLMKEWIKDRTKVKENIIANKRYLSETNFINTLDRLDKDLKVTEQDFAFTGFIVDPTTSIIEIFSYLKWDYEGPMWNRIDGTFYIEGSPNGIRNTIGIGRDKQNAVASTISFLFGRGYIVPMQKVDLYYTSKRQLSPKKGSPKLVSTKPINSRQTSSKTTNVRQNSPKPPNINFPVLPTTFATRSTPQPINVPTYQQPNTFIQRY